MEEGASRRRVEDIILGPQPYRVGGVSDDLYKLRRDVCGDRLRGPVFVFGINGCDCMCCNPINKKTGKPNKSLRKGRIGSVRTTFETARERIGRPDLRFHDLRHTFGTWMNRRGTDINIIKNVVGHADIRTTQRYAHPDTDSMIRAAEVIDFPIDDGAPRQSA